MSILQKAAISAHQSQPHHSNTAARNFHRRTRVMDMNQMPDSVLLLVDLRLTSCRRESGVIALPNSVERPSYLDPCGIAVDMNGSVVERQVAFGKKSHDSLENIRLDLIESMVRTEGMNKRNRSLVRPKVCEQCQIKGVNRLTVLCETRLNLRLIRRRGLPNSSGCCPEQHNAKSPSREFVATL